ncbi:DcaP family trimeric outer membrane transporter [Shewanella submarina]|uniref:DcaP family trimeric outer membrane transporter n=1 Tax=Shewanella submarina TaxID=2016376 RepID=A0ABV7G9C5_9GAMM|nr:DcaP family trimeric outer membrane transporter [Shewanella submarina]MCL1038553.1 DcaP family trimeric outer membrane transporter [Shewanella submarina]
MKVKYLLPLGVMLVTPTYAADFSVGGFLKTNVKFADGDLPFKEIYDGIMPPGDTTRKTQFSAQESRLNATVTKGEVKGFIEIDFANSAQGNSIVSNSYSPRLRHAYISYEGLTVGQTWSTMVNTSTFPESANLGGPLVGEAMVRQALVRYSFDNNAWQVALENPTTYGKYINQDDQLESYPKEDDYIPDLIVRRNFSGDWGNVSVAALVRGLKPVDSYEAALGGSIAGKFNMPGRDDLRIQLHYGNLGRYVGTGAALDIFHGELETTLGGTVAYRHFWNDNLRSSIFYGQTTTEIENNNRRQYAVNLFGNLTRELVVGVEVGRYDVDDGSTVGRPEDIRGSSNYVQFSMQFFI